MSDDRRTLLSRVCFVGAVVPIVVEVVRAIVTDWVPLFDSGYFTVRSRDVLTVHHPLIGAWSSGSEGLDTTLRNLGPLQLDFLAPFTKLDPYWGTAVGVGVVAVASVAAVWFAVGRVLGPLAAAMAMLATLGVEVLIGSRAFIDPRQQLYLLLPFWALLWLTWAVSIGRSWAVGPTVLAASLILQTHFTLGYQAAAVVAVGFAGFLLCHRGRWRDARRPLAFAAVVATICWAQPLWDQIAGEGNLAAVLGGDGAPPGAGFEQGIGILAGGVLVPWSWRLGAMGSFELPWDIAETRSAVVAMIVWTLLVGAAVGSAWRAGRREIAALGIVGGVALLSGVVAASKIPAGVFGLAPQNYFWMWPLGIFVTFGIVAGLIGSRVQRSGRMRSPAVAATVVAVAVVLGVTACRQVNHFAVYTSEESAGSRLGSSLLDQLAERLDELDVDGPLAVDLRRASFGAYFRYIFLAELQRAGIEFTFAAGDRNLDRFGDERCDDGDATGRIVLIDAERGTRLRPDEVLLARLDGMDGDERTELAELDRRFARWLADGTVGVDIDLLSFLAGRETPGLREVLASPRAPVDGLAPVLDRWRAWDAVEVPPELDDVFDRWVDLSIRVEHEVVSIALAPAERFDATPSGGAMIHRFCPG